MKKSKRCRHLEFYKECIKNGRLYRKNSTVPYGGLCKAAEDGQISTKLIVLLSPTIENRIELIAHRKDDVYWGSDSINPELGEFTPLRQNILLLMAAINNEL